MKKIIMILVVLTITFSIVAAAPEREIKVTIDGKEVMFPDQKPIVENQRTLVPVRFVTEALGAKVDWIQKEQKVKIEKAGELIELILGQKKVKAGSKNIELDVAAKAINQRTMVPLRFVSEALGCKVDWNQEGYTVVITTENKELKIDQVITTKEATLIGGYNVSLGEGTPNAEGKKVDALLNKYKYNPFSVGTGYFFDYKIVQKEGFLEPVIYVSSDSPEAKQWFDFQIINEQEYKGKNYKIKFECISNPEYSSKLFGGWQDMNKYFNTLGLSMNDKSKRGDVLKYEISLTDGTITKVYPFTVTLGGEVK